MQREQERLILHSIVIAAVVAWTVAVVVMAACVRTFVPSGIPGCPERQQWSDSAQACRPTEER